MSHLLAVDHPSLEEVFVHMESFGSGQLLNHSPGNQVGGFDRMNTDPETLQRVESLFEPGQDVSLGGAFLKPVDGDTEPYTREGESGRVGRHSRHYSIGKSQVADAC